MPRLPQNTIPPRPRTQAQSSPGADAGAATGARHQGDSASPALGMARRIRMEQGQEQAKRYLFAMEPYLAPAERMFIAEQLGLSLTDAERNAFSGERPTGFAPQPQQSQQSQQPFNMPFGAQYQQQGNPMQALQGIGSMLPLLQMLGGVQGGGMPGSGASGGMPSGLPNMFGGGMPGGFPMGNAPQGGMNDQMALMQTLMGLMGKK